MTFKKIRLLPFLLLALACAHRLPPQHGNTLFPEGTYKHAVRIQIKDQAPYPVNGVLNLTHESLKLYLLGPMDVTAFKVTENFAANTVSIENHMPQLKSQEPYIRRVYDILRTFLLYPRNLDKWGSLKVRQFHSGGYPEIIDGPRNIVFYVTEFKNARPTKFRVEHPHVSAAVEELP